MLTMIMDYDDHYDNLYVNLQVYGIGTYPVFSGLNPYTNDPNCAYKENMAVPVGRYWIVDRPQGTWRNQKRADIIDWFTGGNHDHWFGLFNAQTMTDTTYVNGISRGGFRLHPTRPDGSGISEGCITFVRQVDFYTVRDALLLCTRKVKVQGARSQLLAYGYVDVKGKYNYENCRIR